MKYIVMRKGNWEYPVVFPNTLVHADVAKAMARVLKGDAHAVSAGEYIPMSGICTGSSETLKLKSRGKRDTTLILMADYGGNYVG